MKKSCDKPAPLPFTSPFWELIRCRLQTGGTSPIHNGILDKLIPKPTSRRDGRGRPWKDRRSVLSGILWVLRTGAPWADVFDRYPSYQTCHLLPAMGPLRSHERNSGSSCPRTEGPRCSGRRGSVHRRHLRSGEKRGSKIGKTKRGKGTKIMAVSDRNGLPRLYLCRECHAS